MNIAVRSNGRTKGWTAMLLLCGLAIACSPPTEPATGRPAAPPPALVVSAPAACGQVQFTVSGTSTAAVTFPSAGCGAGLIVVAGGTATWNSTTRILTVPIRVKNTSGQAVEQPISVQLPDTGRVATAPAGQPRTTIVPQSPADSLYSDGSAVWLVGGSTSLVAGDSTTARSLTIKLLSPVSAGELHLKLRTNEIIVGFPATVPTVTPNWFFRDTSLTADRSKVKRVLVVAFVAGTSTAMRQAALDTVQGTVVGGSPLGGIGPPDEGHYFIRVPWATTYQLLDSARRLLETKTVVKYAGPYMRFGLDGRRPNDQGTGSPTWKAADWSFSPDSSGGGNFSLEELALPLAWGCETGAAVTTVGVIEQNFAGGDFAVNAAGGVPILPSPNDSAKSHGRAVASVLAAAGDNNLGMAGVMWRASLILKPTGPVSITTVVDSLLPLLQNNVAVINLSLGNPALQSDSADRADARLLAKMIMSQLRRFPNARPLFVLSAGNQNRDAYRNGFPALKDSIPNQVLVVGASTPRSGTVRSRWVVNSTQGSNSGPTVDIYAPGQNVQVWNDTSAFRARSGTSFSAPMVAGIAGLLKSFDPSLTADEIKALILQGAQRGGRQIVGDAGQYLANAYESLKLAAQRPGTPLCGHPAILRGPIGAQRIVFTSDSLGAARGDSILLPSAPSPGIRVYHDLSAAQGGRRLAVGSYGTDGDQVHVWTLGTTTWTEVQTIAGAWSRTFVERDTVDFAFSSISVTGPSGPRTRAVVADWAAFSFDAKFAVFPTTSPTCGGVSQYGVALYNLTTGTQSTVYSTPCGGAAPTRPVAAVWNETSNGFVTADQEFPGPNPPFNIIYHRFKIVSNAAQAAGAAITIADRRAENDGPSTGPPTMRPDGVTMRWFEGVPPYVLGGSATCRVVTRSAFVPFAIVWETPDGVTENFDCVPGVTNAAPNALVADWAPVFRVPPQERSRVAREGMGHSGVMPGLRTR